MVPDALEKQAGPFAVWQWALIVIGGAGIGLLLRNAFSGDDPAAADLADLPPFGVTVTPSSLSGGIVPASGYQGDVGPAGPAGETGATGETGAPGSDGDSLTIPVPIDDISVVIDPRYAWRPPPGEPQPIVIADPVTVTQPPPPTTVITQPPPPTATRTHTVARGDTLSSIANHFGMTWQRLYDANRAVIGSDPNRIFPGQILVIP